MSRHRVPGLDSRHEVYVGWDQPLLTFFCQVYDRSKDEEENPIFWIGASRPREIYEVEQLVARVRDYAIISHAMRVTLYGDKDDGR